MKRPSIQIIAAVIGFLTALAAFNVLRKFDWGSSKQYKQIGEILSVEGQVERRLPGAVNMETVPGARPLYHQDLLVVQHGSSVTVVLQPNGPTLLLNQNTRFIAEFDATKPGAFIGTLLDGTLNVLNPGRKDLFRLYREGREVSLAHADKTLVPVIPSEPSQIQATGTNPVAATPTPAAETGMVIVATQADDTTNTSSAKTDSTPAAKSGMSENPPTAGAAKPEGESEVLTNEDIIKTMRNQTGFFQRCYLSYIHRAGLTPGGASSGGKVTLSFSVQSSGRVGDAKIVRSDFKDATLHNCIKEVTERARFKSFRGNSIPVQEFPITLQ